MSNDRDRVISITLSEAEWQAFIARQPQPVNWLRDRIRDEVKAEARAASPDRPSAAGEVGIKNVEFGILIRIPNSTFQILNCCDSRAAASRRRCGPARS